MATDPRTVEGYNAGAELYNAHVSEETESPFHTYYEKPAIRAELPNLKGLSVISLGCGNGADARWLKDNGAERVVGVDISSGLIDIAKAKHPDIEFQVMDIEALDFPDESFDLVYSSLVLHYLDTWTKVLRDVRKILKPGGKFIFSDGHPIGSSFQIIDDGKIKKELLGRSFDRETGAHEIYGDYLAAAEGGVRKTKGVVAKIPVYFFHRPISKIVNDIVGSGLIIEKMVEPLPTEGMKTKDLKHYDNLMKIPEFIIWVLRK
jgi:SAM-dependent methyltransferase